MTSWAQQFDTAVKLHQAGKLSQAEPLYRQVLVTQPQNADAWHLLGVLLWQSQHSAQGLEAIRQALALQPNNGLYHQNLGNVLMELKRLPEALAAYRRAVELSPNFADGFVTLGRALRQNGQLDESLVALRSAVKLQPTNANAQFQFGTSLYRARQFDEAIAALRESLRLKPDFSDALQNLGVALRFSGRLEEAETFYRQRLQQPNVPVFDNLVNLGHVLTNQGKLDEALTCFDAALLLRPDSAEVHTNRSVIWLLQGDFARGWPEYEFRYRRTDAAWPTFFRPRWNGETKRDGTILLYAEQGAGDVIQFVRYVPLVRERVGRVLMLTRPALVPLLSRFPGIDDFIVEEQQNPQYDFYSPLMSLPGILGTTLETIPASPAYLTAEESLVARWRERLGSFDGLTIGIAWQGNPEHRDDTLRSIPLREFAPLLQLPRTRFVSLQKGFGVEQLRDLPPDAPVIDLSNELDGDGRAFLDTAAMLKNLDLVVTSDTSVAHLAGALGVTTWLLLAVRPDFRWLLDREDSPWYPTMRLFRQERVNDWASVMGRVRSELQSRTM